MKSCKNAWVLLGVLFAGFSWGCQCDEATTESVTPDFQISGSPPWVSASGGQVTVNFGDVLVGQSKSVDLTVSNKGDFVLKVTKAELGAGTSTEFAYNMAIPLELQPQKDSVISLAYTPTAPGKDLGSVVLTTNVAEGKQYTINLEGNGVQPDIEVCLPEQAKCNDDNKTELALDFGQTELGKSVGPKQVTVKNAGKYALNVKDAVVLSCPWDKPDCAFADMVAPSEPEFILDPASISGTYEAGAETTLNVTYKPIGGGATKSALRITNDDADELEVWVILRGTGIAPRLCPQPPVSLDFGSVQIGNHVDKEFTFTSCGTQPLEVTTVAFAASNTPEFSWTDGTAPEAPVTLQPGESMTLKIRYLPVDVGEDIGRVEIESKDPTAPKGYVDLRGEGTEGPTCNLQASPTTLSFVNIKAGSVGKKNVSLTNVGDAPCSVSSIARISGTDKNEFYLDPEPAYPLAVGAGATVDVTFAYKPLDNTPDNAKWRITSDDPKHPRTDIDLTATPAPTGCFLEANPPALNYGLVNLGQSKSLSFTVTNVGTQQCFVQSNKLDPTSSRSFAIGKITGLTGLNIVLPNGKYTVEVVYTPRVTQTESGKAIVEILQNFVPKTAATVTLSGGGVGPKVCLNPVRVDFGIVNIGSVENRQVEVVSCGTADLTVNSIKLGAGTSADFSLENPLPTGVYKAGEKKLMTVAYKPSDEGEDKGQVDVASTDPITPTAVAKLLGYGTNATTKCGNITGRVCSPGGEIWLGGAEVSAGGRQTTTDPDGYFTLTCVPVGQQNLHIESGSFSTDLSVLVEDRKTTNVSSQCVKGNAKIAVTWGQWDAAEVILDRLGITYDKYGSEGAEDDTRDLLRDWSKLSKYDILIMNCGVEEDSLGESQVLTNLQNFVQGGNSVFASDWALEYCNDPFQGYGTFGNEGSAPGPTVSAQILDPNLIAIMQTNTVRISDWYTQIEKAGAQTMVHIQADTNQDGSMRPMVISAQPFGASGGRCLYTNFHDASQNAQDIDKMFYYLVFQL